MKNPVLENLDCFRRLLQRQTAESALERSFSGSILLFLIFFALDRLVWNWKFWEIPSLRWSAFFILLILWFLNFNRFFHIWRQIPHTRSGVLNLLLSMDHEIHSISPKNRNSEKRSFHQINFVSPGNEKNAPDPLPGTLENALDFLENPQPEISRDLAQAVVSQTEEALKTFRSEKWLNCLSLWRSRNTLRLLTFLAGILMAFFACYSGEKTGTAAKRMIFPWSPIPWKVDFRPQWKTLPNEVFSGATFSAELSVHQEVPFVQVFLWDEETAVVPSEEFRIAPIFGQYRVRIPNVAKSFWISASFPDESPEKAPRFPVRLKTAPQLTDAIIRIQPPLAMRRPPVSASWDVQGLAGSSVGIMIKADRPLKSARVRFGNSTYVPGIPAERPDWRKNDLSNVFKFRFELLRDCDYFIELTDAEGNSTRLPEHSLRILDDLPPVTRALASDSERLILPGAKIRLRLSAQDDLGLADLGFRWIVETPRSQNDDDFDAPRSRDGSLKWTGFTVWCDHSASLSDSNPNANPSVTLNRTPHATSSTSPAQLPLSMKSEYEWDLSLIPLEAGLRIRLEAFASDLAPQRAFSPPSFFRVVSPEEMQTRTFRQWIGITQEMRRIADMLENSRNLLTAPLTQENLSSVSANLIQSVNAATQLLDPDFTDSLPNLISILNTDLSENPEFPFHDQTTSKERLQSLLQLQKTLETISLKPFSELNREVVALAKTFRLAESGLATPADFPHENGLRIREKLDEILEFLRPQVNLWRREEHLDAMRLEFDRLRQRQNKLWDSLAPRLEKCAEFSALQLRQREPDFFMIIEQELWSLKKDSELFCSRFAKIIENSDCANRASNSNCTGNSGIPENSLSLSQTLVARLEYAILLLQNNDFWDLWRVGFQLKNDFEKAEKLWIDPETILSVRQRLLILNKMLTTQEKITSLLEKSMADERATLENGTRITFLNRNLRTAFRDCATIQRQFSVYFVNDSSKSESRSLAEHLEKPTIPNALAAFWTTLCENLAFSAQEFQTIAASNRPPLDLLQDQFTLQLQIYDQLAELAQIANGISEEPGEWTVNADFENRLAEKKTEEPSDATNDDDSQTNASSLTNDEDSANAADENAPDQNPNDALPEIKPEDVQILIAMQEAVFSQTRTLAENDAMPTDEKAQEIVFLAEQQKKIADAAKNLGFNARPNSSFDSIFAQICQVAFLLEKQDLGKMTLSIQEEILYGLRASLQRKKTDDDPQSNDSRQESRREKEDLSQNADSVAQETVAEQEPQNNDSQKSEETSHSISSQSSETLKKFQNSFWSELPRRQQEQLELIPDQIPIKEYRKTIEYYYQNLNQ